MMERMRRFRVPTARRFGCPAIRWMTCTRNSRASVSASSIARKLDFKNRSELGRRASRCVGGFSYVLILKGVWGRGEGVLVCGT